MTDSLNAKDITVTAGSKALVNGASLAVHAGETLVIVGESGAGKSMLSKAMTGLLPRGLTATGTVQIGDNTIDLADAGKQFSQLRGRGIVWLPQDPFTSLSATHRVKTQILGGRRRNRNERKQAVADLLAEVGLAQTVAKAFPHELSGGMRQRVAIAAALDADPAILIADEPTTALDVSTQKEILDLLHSLRDQRAMTIVLITHDLSLAREYGDRIIVMKEGVIVEAGTAQQVLDEPKTAYARTLAAAEPRLDGPAPVRAGSTVRAGSAASLDSAVSLDSAAAGDLEPADLVLDVQGAKKSFGNTHALKGVSLQMKPGESVGIVGQSGSGKSTLARAVVELEELDGGTINLQFPFPENKGKWVGVSRKEWLQQRRKCAQIVFQNPYSALNPALTVGATIREALVAAGEDPASGGDLLERVGLPREYARRRPADLSGGERQRVAIARAIAPRPRLLICDEAVSALDVSVQAQILTLLRTLQDDLGIALLFITHDLAVARQISDRLLVMKDGLVVEEGPTEAVLSDPQHPYTLSLLAAVPGREPGQVRGRGGPHNAKVVAA